MEIIGPEGELGLSLSGKVRLDPVPYHTTVIDEFPGLNPVLCCSAHCSGSLGAQGIRQLPAYLPPGAGHIVVEPGRFSQPMELLEQPGEDHSQLLLFLQEVDVGLELHLE